jgi:hypothetical protein
MVREVAGHEHRIRLRPYSSNRVDCGGEPRNRLGAGPRRTDMRIAELREEEGEAAYDTTSSRTSSGAQAATST